MLNRRVLFIIPTFNAGGAENYVLRFIRQYRSCYVYTVLSISTLPGDLEKDFSSEGVTIIKQSIGYTHPVKIIKLYQFLRINCFDVICCLNGNFAGLPLFIAKLAGIPKRIAYYRRSTIAFSPSLFRVLYHELVHKLVRTYATHILSNSRFALENFFGHSYVSDSRFKVIPNGIDPFVFDSRVSSKEARQILKLPQNDFLVGHVGRMDPAKNHKTILEVARQVIARDASIKFVLCGKNTDNIRMKKAVKTNELEGKIFLLGITEDVPLVLRSFDLFYFPSLTEGQPNALIEAMIAGLPVISSNIPPIKEAIPKSAHCNLLDPKNVEIAVTTIMELKNKPHLRKGYQHQKWAKECFNNCINLEKFKLVLEGKDQ